MQKPFQKIFSQESGQEKGQASADSCPDYRVKCSPKRAKGNASREREKGRGKEEKGADDICSDKDDRGPETKTYNKLTDSLGSDVLIKAKIPCSPDCSDDGSG